MGASFNVFLYCIKKNDLHCEGPNEDELLKAEENEASISDFLIQKVISPSSQEQLHLVMDSFQLFSDCKRKLFGKQSGKKASPVRSDIQSDKVNVNHRQPGQGCSESAIAFSQRQMHDMESLAVKLIDELKSMKDIVEQKLLFEAYRSISLKNNADEKMTPNNTTGSKDAVPRSRKKIILPMKLVESSAMSNFLEMMKRLLFLLMGNSEAIQFSLDVVYLSMRAREAVPSSCCILRH
ncbi:UNVERIFIED_CONTAM: hypothetical protein Sangu_2315800 [Sesamum angustifolium]|uniref:Uncharacterized protein n=1 Tax=Sesamum angustifolium TaxID=2727405 RepID=A0AAW2L6A8_9LAMI